MSLILKRVPPHVSNEATPPLDLSQLICIGLIGLISIFLLLYVLFIRCRYLRRRKCSLCGLAVNPGTGRERIEGFWQRIWHEQCWKKRQPVKALERGNTEQKKVEKRENMALVPPKGMESRSHSASSSVSSTWTPNTQGPSSPLTRPPFHPLTSAPISPLTGPPSHLHDPYAPRPPIGQQQTHILTPPPRGASHYYHPQGTRSDSRAKFPPSPGPMRATHEAQPDEAQNRPRSPLATSYFPITLSVQPTHMLGLDTTMGSGRVAEMEMKRDLPPRQSSRGEGMTIILGQAI